MVGVIESCLQCRSPRLARIRGHCSDTCSTDLAGQHTHRCPATWASAAEDDVHFLYCFDRGQIQGAFPVPPAALEQGRD